MKIMIKSLYVLILISLFIFGLELYLDRITKAESQSSKTKTENIDIKLFSFKPETLEIPVGTTVVWTNFDAIEHSVTNGTPEKPGSEFDSNFFTEGQTFTFTFDKPGNYPYFCKRHNSMMGEIKIVPTTP
jgi:plastocyanin